MARVSESLIAVANDKDLNPYDPSSYTSRVELFDENSLTDDHRALNILGTFRPRPYQVDSMNFMLQKDPKTGRFREGLRAALCDHRRAGKSIRTMKIIAMRALQQVGVYFLVYPTLNQGRKVIWDGIAYNEKKEAYKIIEVIPQELWKRKDNHLMSLELKNGSIIQIVGAVGTDGTPDHLRGTNPIFAAFDEFAAMNPEAWTTIISPVLAENGGSAMFTFTPDGKNHAYRLLKDYIKKWEEDERGKFFGQINTIETTKRHDGSPVISTEYLDELRDQGVPEEYIQREFYCSFDVANDGSFYNEVLDRCYKEGRVGVVKHDNTLPVFAAFDLGIGLKDFVAVWLLQIPNSNTINFINYLEFPNKALFSAYATIGQLPYPLRVSLLPWDANRRDDLTGLTKVERLEEANITSSSIERVERVSVEHGIELVRGLFKSFYFDKAACFDGLERIRAYQKKQDRVSGVYLNSAVHNDASHGCDALRTLANAIEQGLLSEYTDIIEEGDLLYDFVEHD